MNSPTDASPPEEEMTIPRAAMNKMIKEILPTVRVSNEARELVLNCCTEFIHLLSSEANEICSQQTKKTISSEHILLALEKLGFGDYKADAEAVIVDCKAVAADRKKKQCRPDTHGATDEELLKLQQELIAKAREEQDRADREMFQQIHEQMAVANQQLSQQPAQNHDDDDDYS